MSRLGRRDGVAEMRLRSLLHAGGLRFRVDHSIAGLPRRRADIVFVRARVAVFVDGCFWHGCPEHCVQPKANAGWWKEKIEANRRRDAETNALLARDGWEVIRIWEHEDPETVAAGIREAVLTRAGAKSQRVARR